MDIQVLTILTTSMLCVVFYLELSFLYGLQSIFQYYMISDKLYDT